MEEDLSKYNEDDVKIIKFLWENQGNVIDTQDIIEKLQVKAEDFFLMFNRWRAMCAEQGNKKTKPIQESLF